MPEIKLTPQQAQAVYDRGGELLVSAAAGSGKTKVLVERLFSYLEQGTNVDDFLIITYTKAAASELRGKIAVELNRRLAEDPENNHLRRQIFRIYQADIKTVDAFCVGILRQNAHLLEPVGDHTLTPDFRVLDESEAAVLRQHVLERTMEEFYESMDENDRFLAETLGAGRDDRRLTELVLQLQVKLQSHPYPERWLQDMKAQWETIPEDISQTAFAQLVMQNTVERADFWAERLEKATELCRGDEKLRAGYEDRFLEAAAQLRQYREAATQGWDAMGRIRIGFRPMGRAPDSPEKVRLQAILKQCKEALKQIAEPFAVSMEEHREDLVTMSGAMLSLIGLTSRFSRNYRAEKVRRNAMDFSDQEHYAIELLRQNDAPTELAKTLCERYREVMVDEYQDSNAVQDCIFQSVSAEGEHLFCVGDVKQSIYRFRLADPTIFLAKYLTFTDAEAAEAGVPRRVVLSRNFRSREAVLDAANFVIENIMSREMGEMDYGEQERLYHGADYYLPRTDCATEFHFVAVEDTEEQTFDRVHVEADFVADRIRRLLDEGFPVQEGDHFRPCTPEDIVLLMRSPGSRLKTFTEALERRHIPYASGEKSGFFDTVEIAIVFSLLQIIDNPRQDVPLISVLRSPLFGFTADLLAEIRAKQMEGSFFDALLLDEREESRAFLLALEEARRESAEESVDGLLWELYCRFHILSIISAMPQGEERRRNLLALYDYARQMAASGRRSVFAFVTELRRLMENDQTPAMSTHSAAGGVQIMSIHKSKGLEFPIVILCDMNRRFDPRDLQAPVLVHQSLGLGTERVDIERRVRYDTLSKTALAMQMRRESLSEEMRILYVALSRAKEKMILVDCMKKGRKRVQDLCAVACCPVAPQAVADGRALGDWVLLPLLCKPEAACLREWADAQVDTLFCDAPAWDVHLWVNPAAETEEIEFARAEKKGSFTVDAGMLEFIYPHFAATQTPTKVTATQLKGREVDAELTEGRYEMHGSIHFEKPLFLQEAVKLNAAEKGTAIHLVLQYLPLDLPAIPEAVREFVDQLVEKRLLTKAQARAVDDEIIVDFLKSGLCSRIRAAAKVWREYRFDLLVDAGMYDASAAGEEMMLQGVVDCAFVEEGKLIIVDFKTDRINAAQAQERARSYAPQLNTYATALEKVLEYPIGEKIIHFIHINSSVSL